MQIISTLLIGLTLSCCTVSFSFAANISLPHINPSEDYVTRGVLRAAQKAQISAGMTGQLLEAPYKSGHFFESGALLAKFDCSIEMAELSSLLKKHKFYDVKYKNTAELYKYGAAGEFDIILAKTEMEQAFAEINLMQKRLKHCDVYAPFSGYIITQHVSAYETLQIGEPLYSLEKSGALELSIIIPSKWTRWLERGQSLDFTVDETGDILKAKIIRLGASIDPISQTIEVIAQINSHGSVMSGMSGHARFVTTP